ncbi:Ribosomal protein L11 methyltransferase [bacterium HR39]|nr:Ribosomal protein L11 methyltransferase [bacterium HR39]
MRGMWRLAFVTTREPDEEALAELAGEAAALAVYVQEEDADGDPVRWRVELFLPVYPDPERWRGRSEALFGADAVEPPLVTSFLPEEDWVKRATALRGPVRVGRLLVRAPGSMEPVEPGTVVIELEAGLAFGSGEHESTRGCLLALDWLARRRLPERVLDLGTGSGILAIAAAKVWPEARMLAVDEDPVAVEVARANVVHNGVATRVEVRHAAGYRNVYVRRRAPFDLVLANILADPLIAMARDLARHLAPGGHAVLSGLLERQAEAVVEAHRRAGLREVQRIRLDNWTTLILRRPRNRPDRRRRSGALARAAA